MYSSSRTRILRKKISFNPIIYFTNVKFKSLATWISFYKKKIIVLAIYIYIWRISYISIDAI